jgi:hypothetical protein
LALLSHQQPSVPGARAIWVMFMSSRRPSLHRLSPKSPPTPKVPYLRAMRVFGLCEIPILIARDATQTQQRMRSGRRSPILRFDNWQRRTSTRSTPLMRACAMRPLPPLT